MFSQSGRPLSRSCQLWSESEPEPTLASQCLERHPRLRSQVIWSAWTRGAGVHRVAGDCTPWRISPRMSPRDSVSWWTRPGHRWGSWIRSRLMSIKGKYSKRTSRGWRKEEAAARTRTQDSGFPAPAQVLTFIIYYSSLFDKQRKAETKHNHGIKKLLIIHFYDVVPGRDNILSLPCISY